MGCQRDIAEQVTSFGGDYVLSLKGNQDALNEDVRLLFRDEALLKEMNGQEQETVEGDHGRIETRKYCSIAIPELLKEQHQWPGLMNFIEVYSRREIKKTGFVEEEKRYYISSLNQDIGKISKAIRSHWDIKMVCITS